MTCFLKQTFLSIALLLSCFVNAAVAQQQPDYDLWAVVVDRAEAAVDAGTANDTTLNSLRNRLVKFRASFEAAQDTHSERIDTLKSQIEALGPKPSGDNAEPEPKDVADKRAELDAELARLQGPSQVAQAEYRRADGLIGEIDSILRTRKTDALFAVAASPANPSNWGQAWTDLTRALAALSAPASVSLASERWKQLRQNLPVVLLSLVAGLVLVFRGRLWATRIVAQLSERGRGPRFMPVWRFLLSLLRIFLPLLGLVLLCFAAMQSGYLGAKGYDFTLMVAFLGAFILGFRWISERIFSREDDEALVPLPLAARGSARFWVGTITLAVAFIGALTFVLHYEKASIDTLTVVTFPITLILSFGLFRLGQILRSYRVDEEEAPLGAEVSAPRTLPRIVRLFGTGAMIVAIVGPVLQLAGYYNARVALMSPFVMTLAIFGLVMALKRFAADVYGAVTGQGAAARESLLAVLIGMALTVLALPVLALIWGTRWDDLTEVWASFLRGVAVGDTRISPTNFMTFAVIFAVGYFVTRLLQGTLRTSVLPKTRIDVGGQNALVSGIGYIGIFLSALLAITGAGIDLSSLAIVVGALSVGIGFGLQNIVSNFVSGIILLIERPISEGDWIEVGGKMGYVRDISVRSTRIQTFDRSDVIVPNADLVSGTVTNYTRGNTVGRLILSVGVAYGSDSRLVEKLLKEIATAHPMVLANPGPSALFVNFGADALEFEVRCFLRDVNFSLSTKSEMNHQIYEKLSEAGIEIPFAQRDLWLRNPEALQADK